MGVKRAKVQVLRGNPAMCGQLIDSLRFVQRYSSCVINWAPEDRPTEDEINAVLDDFQRVAFAGLRPDQYTYAAVLHEEASGGVHIHVITPRVELTTGMSLNIAPPNWKYIFDPMRDFWNRSLGWARPDDPLRARAVQPERFGTWAAWQSGADPKLAVTEWLTVQVNAGLIDSREDVLACLKEIGTVNRVNADFISVRLEATTRPIRLKGTMYGANFNGEAFRKAGSAAAGRSAGREKPDPDAAAGALSKLERAISARAAYNERRYRTPRPRPEPAAFRDYRKPSVDDVVAPAVQSGAERHDCLDVGGVELVDRKSSVGVGASQTGSGAVVGTQLLRESSGARDLCTERVIDDRDRSSIDNAIAQVDRAFRTAYRAIDRCTASAIYTVAAVSAACRRSREAIAQLTKTRTAKSAGRDLEASIAVAARRQFRTNP